MGGGVIVAYKLEDVDIDKNVTTKNVRRFFRVNFITYLNRAGLHSADLSSAQLDPTGISSRGKNSSEEKMMRIFDYQAKCGAIYFAIIDCMENDNLGVFNQKILKYRYIDNIPDSKVQERLGISPASYGEKKASALIEFADRLPVWGRKFDTKFPELRKFIDTEELK